MEARVEVGVLARPEGNGEAVLVQRDGRPAMAASSIAEYKLRAEAVGSICSVSGSREKLNGRRAPVAAGRGTDPGRTG